MSDKNFSVIGCGKQGEIVVDYLTKKGYNVTVFDIKEPYRSDCSYRRYDATSRADVKLLRAVLKGAQTDVVINCLPSGIAEDTQLKLADTGLKVVDICFNLLKEEELKATCERYKTLYIPDCGLAPGIPNLIIGEELRKKQTLNNVEINVGGISSDPKAPFGYVITWDPEGLETEYSIPARIIKSGVETTLDPLSNVTEYKQGLERFPSDGLRSLLSLNKRIKNMVEYTIRREGHCESIKDLIDLRQPIARTLSERCSSGIDLVIEEIICDGARYSLGLEGTYITSAMAKITGTTCAVVAEVVSQLDIKEKALISPEYLSENYDCWHIISERLREEGVVVNEKA